MYDLHRLRLLRELKLRGTLAAVASALGYSPSAISHQLSALEREVGVPLLEPVGRSVRLTAAAETLVGHTDAILIELERAEAAIAASRTDVSGTVRIATFQTAAHTLIPTALEALATDYPQLEVAFSHVHAEAAIPGLVARDFDVVLSERYPGEPPAPLPGITTEPLGAEPLVLAIPQAWSAQCLEDLADAPWVMEHLGTSARSWSTALCRSTGFDPRVQFQSADVYLHARLVEQGLAAGLLPRLGIGSASGARLVPLDQVRTIELSLRTGSGPAPGIGTIRKALVVAARQAFRGHPATTGRYGTPAPPGLAG